MDHVCKAKIRICIYVCLKQGLGRAKDVRCHLILKCHKNTFKFNFNVLPYTPLKLCPCAEDCSAMKFALVLSTALIIRYALISCLSADFWVSRYGQRSTVK